MLLFRPGAIRRDQLDGLYTAKEKVMPLTQKSRANIIIHSYAVGAATWSALTAAIPVVGPGLGDTAGLTAITIAMTYSLAALFGKKLEEGAMWSFGAVVLGAVFGVSILRKEA